MRNLALLGLLFPSMMMAGEIEMPISVNSPKNTQCTVRTSSSTFGYQGRCRFDEVMTGIRTTNPLIVNCSRLLVECRDIAQKHDQPE